MAMNDAFHWRADLGGGYQVGLVQAGRFRSDAGAIFGPTPRVLWEHLVAEELDASGRLLQALNCLVIETPGGRVLVETGIGERVDERGRSWRGLEGLPIVPTLEAAGVEPGSIDVVALSHLHWDHAGGLLRADESVAFPRARIVAQRAEWEIAFSENPRIVASYDQPELRLVRAWGEAGSVDGEMEFLPGVWTVPTGGHSKGHQAIVVRAPGRTLVFFGDIAMRPWSANPRWIPAFDDFPLDSVVTKLTLFARAAAEGWTVVLSHEPRVPVGRLVPDRDRFAWQPI